MLSIPSSILCYMPLYPIISPQTYGGFLNWRHPQLIHCNRMGFSRTKTNQILGIPHWWKSHTGWWFEPLWKILVNWHDYSQYMGNKKCSKPPTSICCYPLHLVSPTSSLALAAPCYQCPAVHTSSPQGHRHHRSPLGPEGAAHFLSGQSM